jgi:hypothetical protein
VAHVQPSPYVREAFSESCWKEKYTLFARDCKEFFRNNAWFSCFQECQILIFSGWIKAYRVPFATF